MYTVWNKWMEFYNEIYLQILYPVCLKFTKKQKDPQYKHKTVQ